MKTIYNTQEIGKKTREADQKERNRKNFLQRPKKGVSKEPKMMEGDIENGNGG